ncbi:MAG: O-antigen ligase family protein [Holosporales bacterium]|nr:O-antigen ligase family protein [Holosporales bacterium]
MKSSFKNFFCFELLFVLFLFSPQYKNSLTAYVKIDLTLLLSLIIIPIGYYLMAKESRIRSQNGTIYSSTATKVLFLAFTGWCCCRSFGLPVTEYPYSKILCFFLYTMQAFFLSYLVIARDENRLYRFMLLTLIFAIAINFECYRIFLNQIQSRAALNDVLGNNYLITGQTLGIGVVILSGILLAHTNTGGYQIYLGQSNAGTAVWMVLLSSIVYMSLNLGGRGPVISMLLATAVLSALSLLYAENKTLGRMLKNIVYFILASCVLYLLIELILKTGKQSALFERISYDYLQSDESILLRIKYYKSAWKCFTEHYFTGIGFGGWPYYQGLGDMYYHPHNIFLEIMCETGLVGLTLFLALLSSIFAKFSVQKLVSSPFVKIFLCVFLFCFMNALKSGDLNDNIALFCYLGIMAGVLESPAKIPQA